MDAGDQQAEFFEQLASGLGGGAGKAGGFDACIADLALPGVRRIHNLS